MTYQYQTRQGQMWAIEDRRRYHEHRESYLRAWALDVTKSCGNHPGDIQAVREMPVTELQEWYDEAHS